MNQDHVNNSRSHRQDKARGSRILAVDPGTRYMGLAILAGSDLVYYAVRRLSHERPADVLLQATRAELLRLIRTYHPTILAYEKTFYVQQKTSALLHVQELEIARLGRSAGLRVVGYPPPSVRKIVCGNGRATKEAVADVLAERFLELRRYRAATDGRREYWLNMFDALAVAVACAEKVDGDGRGEAGRAA